MVQSGTLNMASFYVNIHLELLVVTTHTITIQYKINIYNWFSFSANQCRHVVTSNYLQYGFCGVLSHMAEYCFPRFFALPNEYYISTIKYLYLNAMHSKYFSSSLNSGNKRTRCQLFYAIKTYIYIWYYYHRLV